MKIGEVLELTKQMRLSDIAKKYLTIGEKPARLALKKAGCFAQSGKRGWYFEGNEEILQMDIYDFVEGKGKINAKKVSPAAMTKVVQKTATEVKEVNEKKVKRKRTSFDLDVDLFKQIKVKSVLEDKHVYELVEQAIKEFLSKS